MLANKQTPVNVITEGWQEGSTEGEEEGRDIQRLTNPANGFGSRAKENHRAPREDSSSLLCLVIQSVFTSTTSLHQQAEPRSCSIHHSSVPTSRQEVPKEEKSPSRLLRHRTWCSSKHSWSGKMLSNITLKTAKIAKKQQNCYQSKKIPHHFYFKISSQAIGANICPQKCLPYFPDCRYILISCLTYVK